MKALQASPLPLGYGAMSDGTIGKQVEIVKPTVAYGCAGLAAKERRRKELLGKG